MAFFKSCFLWILITCFIKGTQQTSAICSSIVANLDCTLDPPSPVCSTGGTTFTTRCEFAKAHCQNSNVHLAHEGACLPAELPHTDPICPQLSVFTCPQTTASSVQVCASDTTTYPSLCHYQQARCRNPNLKLLSIGFCVSTTIPTTTTTTTTTTANTDNLTPSSAISTTPTSTTTTSPSTTTTTPTTTATTLPTTTMSTFDLICQAIKDKPCPTESKPVCGSDSVTYDNACNLEKTSCTTPGLHLVSEHPC